MGGGTSWLQREWNRYKYRFVPWIVFNVNQKTARTVQAQLKDLDVDAERLVDLLVDLFQGYAQYKELDQDLDLFRRLHVDNSVILRETFGFRVSRAKSSVPGAGSGVFVADGVAKQGSIVGLYPGTLYQPYQPIFFQSIRNQFIFRCADGTLIDGSDGYLSGLLFKSCVGRDQIGMVKVGDTSWLTPCPVNPLNVGQYVNNATNSSHVPNVMYQEVDLLTADFPLHLRKFLPNIHYASSAQDGARSALKLVLLVACRDVCQGEELLSSYFTVIQ